jgi:hypothetical protein
VGVIVMDRLKAVLAAIDVSDALVLGGLVLLARGLWMVAPWSAYVAIGAVLIWYALPARPPFIAKKD